MQLAMASFTRAFDYYVDVGAISDAVAIAQFPLAVSAGRRLGISELIARSLSLVGPDSIESGYLLSRYPLTLGTEGGQSDHADKAFDRALSIAQKQGDTELEMWTLSNASRVVLKDLEHRDVVKIGSKSIQIARKSGNLRAEVMTRFFVSMAIICLGEPAELLSNAEEVVGSTVRLGDRQQKLWA